MSDEILAFETEVKCCARCGKDHVVTFKKLTNPHDSYPYWGNCPHTGEPILLKIEQTPD